MTYDNAAVNKQYQGVFGRDATDAEHEFFKPIVEGGYLSPYQIGQYAAGTPEAQQARLGQYGQQYNDMLGQSDQRILGLAGQEAQSQFAQAGRPYSSGQGNAILQAGQNLASQRQSLLANFYGQGYQGLMGNYANQGQAQLGRAYGLQDSATDFNRSIYINQMQQNAYEGQMDRNRNAAHQDAIVGGLFSLGGALGGAAIRRSDRRLKTNVRKIGYVGQLSVYSFEYNRADLPKGQQIGHMADEVESIYPHAVSIDADGYKLVNYAAIPSGSRGV